MYCIDGTDCTGIKNVLDLFMRDSVFKAENLAIITP